MCLFVCLFVGLLVCLLFIGHTTFVHFAALPPSTPRAAMPSSQAAPRGVRGQAHANCCADAFQKQNRTRAHAVVYVTAEIFKKKGKRKPTCHFPSPFYSSPSLGVLAFRIVLNRILHKSSLLAPMESRRTRRPTFTAEERLERRREQDRRRHAER